MTKNADFEGHRRRLAGTLVLCAMALVVSAEHHEGHDRGGSVERWLPHLERDGRDQWQRPDDLVALLGIEPGMVVADLGAGTGYLVGRLAAAAGPDGRVLALDVDQQLVDYMTERFRNDGVANVEPRRVAGDDPGLEAGSVDRLVTVNTWHHIEERESYAAKLAAALAPGGRIYVVDFTLDSPHGPPVDHRLTAAEVRAELEAGGLVTELLDEELPYQYVVVATAAE